ncbi:hypothetical protein [Adhaeretor mobilis]|uniref:Uncharacterized protein n=1 Tax=Adhaeretor mobilis TaxID=1930276 RepID=A0A517N356_9BACT|nr:hypothetical protein [Adhaeretor mobilis]QDT01563.1 hypothetical protein HG15A2_49100 [Adhaeretor mobilis]
MTALLPMTARRTAMFAFLLSVTAQQASAEKFLLQASNLLGEPSQVTIDLQLGGDLIVPGATEEGPTDTKRVLPLSMQGQFSYQEKMLKDGPRARSLRLYEQAQGTEKTDEATIEVKLPKKLNEVVCELRDGRTRMQSCEGLLTREQCDLLDVVGNTLVLNRLLPNREVEEGDTWNTDGKDMAAILGLDNAGICEVSSVVVGEKNDQVQIRMAGSLHGGVDGAALEMEIKGAYLFHLREKRITKINLVVKEKRKIGDATPGLDSTAKLSITVRPTNSDASFTKDLLATASALEIEPQGRMLFDSPQRGYRFAHAGNWYVTAGRRDLVSLRLLEGGTKIAHCNVTTLPPRSAGRATKLEQFKQEVKQSLGENINEIEAANEWTSSTGHNCLAVFANGTMKDIEVQWRYYLVADDDVQRVSVVSTVERAQLDKFADADRLIVDSIELVGTADEETAAK